MLSLPAQPSCQGRIFALAARALHQRCMALFLDQLPSPQMMLLRLRAALLSLVVVIIDGIVVSIVVVAMVAMSLLLMLLPRAPFHLEGDR